MKLLNFGSGPYSHHEGKIQALKRFGQFQPWNQSLFARMFFKEISDQCMTLTRNSHSFSIGIWIEVVATIESASQMDVIQLGVFIQQKSSQCPAHNRAVNEGRLLFRIMFTSSVFIRALNREKPKRILL